MTLKHAQAELKTKQAEVKKMDSGYKKDQDTLKAVKNSREKLEAELAKLNYEGTNSWLFMYLFKLESPAVTYEMPFLYKPVYWQEGFFMSFCRWEGRKSAGKKKAAVQRDR